MLEGGLESNLLINKRLTVHRVWDSLMGYLTRDCCGGNPEICADLFPLGESDGHPVPAASRERVE